MMYIVYNTTEDCYYTIQPLLFENHEVKQALEAVNAKKFTLLNIGENIMIYHMNAIDFDFVLREIKDKALIDGRNRA